jgi:hypothetical protein
MGLAGPERRGVLVMASGKLDALAAVTTNLHAENQAQGKESRRPPRDR